MTEDQKNRTTGVLILGAGPAGLVLANLLQRGGIDCVVLERSDHASLAERARAGYLAPETVRTLERHGLADGLLRHGTRHGSCEFRTEAGRFRLDYGSLGEPHTVYPQQELVADLLAAYQAAGGQIRFGLEALAVHDLDSPRPWVSARSAEGAPVRWAARYVAGCDGRHGAARRSLPPGATSLRRDHGVSWLALLAEAPPSLDAVAYAVHPRGFAGHMARTPQLTRYYLQSDDGLAAWPDERIWAELRLRLGAERYEALNEGPFVGRAVVALESDVLTTLRHGSLLLAGDAASLISPSAAKGANLAVLAAELLAEALIDSLAHGDHAALDRYSERCLGRIWRAQEFSRWMVSLLHPDRSSAFDDRLRRSRLESLRTSAAFQHWFADHYVGV